MNKAPKNNRINKLVLPKQVDLQDIKNIKIKLHNKYIKKPGFHKQCTINYNPTSKKRGLSLHQPSNIEYKVNSQQNFMNYWRLSQQIKQLNQNKCVCKNNCHLHVNNQNNSNLNVQYNKSNAIYQLNRSSSQIKIPHQPKIYYQPVISHPICAICTRQHQLVKQTNLNLQNHRININNKPHFHDTKAPFLRNKQQKRSQSANCLLKIDDLKIGLQKIQQKVNRVKELINIPNNLINSSKQYLVSAMYDNPQLYINPIRQQYIEKNERQLIRNNLKEQRDQQLARTRIQTPKKKRQNNYYQSPINSNRNIYEQRRQNQTEQNQIRYNQRGENQRGVNQREQYRREQYQIRYNQREERQRREKQRENQRIQNQRIQKQREENYRRQNQRREKQRRENQRRERERIEKQRGQILRTKLLGSKQAESRYEIDGRVGSDITFSNEQIAFDDYHSINRTNVYTNNNGRQRQGVGRFTNHSSRHH